MENPSTSLIESVLSSVFDFYKKRIDISPKDRADFDFVINEEDHSKVAIEVKKQPVAQSSIIRLVDLLQSEDEISGFYLITATPPDKKQNAIFEKYICSVLPNSKWLTIEQYLEKNYNLTFKNKEDLSNIQLAAITSKLESYSKENIGTSIPQRDSKSILASNLTQIKGSHSKLSSNLLMLRRQFPDSILANLSTDDDQLNKELFIGRKYPNAVIVLTDIKNFSKLVSSAEPEELNRVMTKYYANSRDLVFKYGGILDKFIGDAVLAIFNYPHSKEDSFLKSLKFCSELIQLGRSSFGSLLANMDQSLDVSTRIGVSNGPIYSLNIGRADMEVTFLGDKINLAARLEHNCESDGILLSNKFFSNFMLENPELKTKFPIKQRKLDPSQAPGQFVTTMAWQISAEDVQTISELRKT